MRLINAETLRLEEFNDGNIPLYAILSHTWGPAGSEISFQDMQDLSLELKDRQGYAKITGCCAQALHDDLKWAWVDTCCIDKSSSAELSESINSMFAFYKKAEKCYAYLADVESSIDVCLPEQDGEMNIEFDKSKWFTRGWTVSFHTPSHLNIQKQTYTRPSYKSFLPQKMSSSTPDAGDS
jgi:Heterokaryon incompatibility protein (HET)